MNKKHLTPITKGILLAILFLAFLLRTYNINWDKGTHLHPDERAIVMTVEKLSLPSSLSAFFSEQSPLNPHFFAYGSLPFYLLKLFAYPFSFLDPDFGNYTKINILGRLLSALADTGTVLVLFFIGKKLFSEKTGLLVAALYTTAVFPIQTSHFYAVDILLTFFTILTLWQIIRYLQTPSLQNILLLAIFTAAAIATKISAILLIAPLGIALMAKTIYPHLAKKQKNLKKSISLFLTQALFFTGVGVLFLFLFEPYAFIDFDSFWQQTTEQAVMTKSAFTFPYTLQYVGITPYWYQLKQIFLWGLGPLLSLFAATGFFYLLVSIWKKKKEKLPLVIVLIFFLLHLAIVGSFAVGWMRYMLPVYPLIVLFAAILFEKILAFFSFKKSLALGIVLSLLLLIWPLSFMQIYTKDHTRMQASDWIHRSIPADSSLAVEYWDDALPLYDSNKYTFITLDLYQPDTTQKWHLIREQLLETDYIILSSQRLAEPLQKLTNCQKLSPNFCYPLTAAYYHQLLTGALGFQKVAEFTSFPTIPFTNITINDQSADESFTVYDHPHVIIFKRL